MSTSTDKGYEYTSKTTLIEKEHDTSRNSKFWCRICGIVAVLMTILAAVFIALYAVEAHRKPHHHSTINPTMYPNTTYNPNMTTTFNPNVTTTFNPNMTTPMDLNVTTTIHPNMTTTFNPNVTTTVNVTATTTMVMNTTMETSRRTINVTFTMPTTTKRMVEETKSTNLDEEWPTLPHHEETTTRPHRRTTTDPDPDWTENRMKRSINMRKRVPKKEHDHKSESVLLGSKF